MDGSGISFIPFSILVILLVVYIASENRAKVTFEGIPSLEVSDDSVTILNYGTI